MSQDDKVPLRVIGVGSPFGDDVAGWQAIEKLREEVDLFPSDTELFSLDRPGSSLLPLLENTKTVVLIDAMQSNQAPGTVERVQLSNLLMQSKYPSSHTLGIAESLALANALSMLPERLVIYGIEMGEDVPAVVWYPQLREQIRQEIN